MKSKPQLGREDWLRAARRALHHSGADAVRVETLAEALGVTKGSFYWHFADRDALLESLIAEWEDEHDLIVESLPPLVGADGFRELIEFVAPRVAGSPQGDAPSDAAMFAWAATDPAVAKRVNAAEERRLALVQRVVGDKDVGEFIYLAYLGFLMRRRRVPAAAKFFATLASIAQRMVESKSRAKVRMRRERREKRVRLG